MQQGSPQQQGYLPYGQQMSERPPRPPHSTSHTSGTVPTLNQMSPSSSSRPPTSSSHSYSRSSPAAKYVPFSPGNPPETPQYQSQRSYYPPETPVGGVSQSPLALADIRGPVTFDSEMLSPNPLREAAATVQSPSSYLAPWPIYAFDWCNWAPSPGTGAGKVAICSYLEDPHNFVSVANHNPSASSADQSSSVDTNIRHNNRATRNGTTRITSVWRGVFTNSGGYLLVSHHTDTLGTAIRTKAID
jgi:hypothetical protein